MVANANKRTDAFEQDQQQDDAKDSFIVGEELDGSIVGKRDNSRKAYYKEFRKVVENADVILEVLDARDPLGCRVKKIEEMILGSGTNKRVILILNKIGKSILCLKSLTITS